MLDLVIDLRDGGDWSLDLCFAGLVKNLGFHRVFDFPNKEKHREWGYGDLDWGKERRTLGYTPDQPPRYSISDLIEARDDGKIARVWLDERMESFAKYRELGLDKTNADVIVVAGHDRFWNHSPQFVAALYGDRLRAMLLDNWYEEYSKLPFPARRIGWSCNFDHYWTRPAAAPVKDIDICFVGYNSHPDRARFIDHIQNNWSSLRAHIVLERQPDKFDQFIPRAEMFDIMLRSKICLNLRGAADRGKTLRAYEIPYVGSYMLSQRIEDPGMMQDFEQGIHCDYFSDEYELDKRIHERIVEVVGSHQRELIAGAGHRRAVTDLSVRSRWAEVLRWIEEIRD
jgi:hypothetical protein